MDMTYDDLKTRFGRIRAYDLLRTVEELAQIKDEIMSIDMDARLQRALKALNETNFIPLN